MLVNLLGKQFCQTGFGALFKFYFFAYLGVFYNFHARRLVKSEECNLPE